MSDVRIRIAAPTDLDAVEALEDRVFAQDELSRRSLRYYIGTPNACFLVLESGGAILGDAIVAMRKGARVARLYSIAVSPEGTGRGYGRALLEASEAVARERKRASLRLEVRSDNAAAIGFYEASGYRRFGSYDDYYEDGTAALRYEKAL